MTSRSKAKGDRAERLAAELLTERTRYTVKRRFGAGQEQDEGDLYGIPGVALQICDWKDKSAALHQKPPQCDEQAKNALAEFCAALLIQIGCFGGCSDGSGPIFQNP